MDDGGSARGLGDRESGDRGSGDQGSGDRELLRQFLEARDVPCPACGFNLRGCAGDRCPECGRPVSLVVRGGERIAWPSLVGLVGAAMGAGFCLVVTGVAVIQTAPSWARRGPRLEVDLDREHAQVAALGLVFFGLSLFVWMMHARSRPRWTRWASWTAAAITLAALAALVGLVAVIR